MILVVPGTRNPSERPGLFIAGQRSLPSSFTRPYFWRVPTSISRKPWHRHRLLNRGGAVVIFRLYEYGGYFLM